MCGSRVRFVTRFHAELWSASSRPGGSSPREEQVSSHVLPAPSAAGRNQQFRLVRHSRTRRLEMVNMTDAHRRMKSGQMMLGAARIKAEALSKGGDPSAGSQYAERATTPLSEQPPIGSGGELVPLERLGFAAPKLRAVRLAGAVARGSATFQQGLLTLRQLRSGGKQDVTVTHVHQQVSVSGGGQAIVAGEMKPT